MARLKKIIRDFNICADDDTLQTRIRIFHALKKQPGISIGEIAKVSGVSLDDVSGYIDLCVKRGVLMFSASGEKDTVKFTGPETKGDILGVGFADGKCYFTVIDFNGKVLGEDEIEIDRFSGFKGKKKELLNILERIREASGLTENKYLMAGIAVPVRFSDLNSKAAEIVATGISRIFKTDVCITSDITAAAYEEGKNLDGAKVPEMLYLHSDVGMGVVIKGENIFEADKKGANDDRSYLRLWQQFNVVSVAKDLVGKGVGTKIVNMADGNIENITLEVILDAAENEDELAQDLVKRSGLALGVRVAYLVNMFNVEVVVLGGGIEKKEGGFIDLVRESSGKFLLKKNADKVEIMPATGRDNVTSLGAASLCRREIFMEV